jgi:hypothetical protein
MFNGISIPCGGLDEWAKVQSQYPFLNDSNWIQSLVRNIQSSGFVDPLHGLVRPNEFAISDENYREGFLAHGSNSRYRAILANVVEYVLTYGRCSTIYLAEHESPFARMMREKFPYLLTSEYISNPLGRWKLAHIRHEDPLQLSLPDHAFDLYIASDTMIYAASMEGVLREARRVLRRTGVFLATFPFRYGAQETEVRAEIIDGEIVHYTDPTYHPDPFESDRQRLMFFVPGWDILDVARASGFQSAEIIVHSSRANAILGAEIGAVFVLRATA